MIRPAVRPLVFLLLASSALIPAAVQAQALPTGGSVARGGATIATPADGAMTISQASDRAVINWQSFSIGEGNRVDIRQPDARSVLLNRVAGDATSTIAGSLNANGQVFLINPNGIEITATGTVRAAGFVASTLDIGDDDFMKGDIVVTGRGGRVANAGTIAIVRGGYAALIGGQVDNSGLIHAPLGRVMLGSGARATLDGPVRRLVVARQRLVGGDDDALATRGNSVCARYRGSRRLDRIAEAGPGMVPQSRTRAGDRHLFVRGAFRRRARAMSAPLVPRPASPGRMGKPLRTEACGTAWKICRPRCPPVPPAAR